MTEKQNEFIKILKSNGCNISLTLKATGVSFKEYKQFMKDSDFADQYEEAEQYRDDFADAAFMKLIKSGDKRAITEYKKHQYKQEQEARRNDLINVSDGALLVSTASDLDKEAKRYKAQIRNKMTEAGTITQVDEFYLQRLMENYRVYIGLRDAIGGNYERLDRFGEMKPHHLLTELRAVGDRVDSLLKEGGLTPRSRSISGIGASNNTVVPHGNSHSSNVLDIINGG